jgi:hypothetical protein
LKNGAIDLFHKSILFSADVAFRPVDIVVAAGPFQETGLSKGDKSCQTGRLCSKSAVRAGGNRKDEA